MNLNTMIVENILVVNVEYDYLDANNISQFRDEIKTLLGEPNTTVFDLSSLQFIDSSGLGAFLFSMRMINAKGGSLALCALQPTVRSIFEQVRMNKVIDVYATRETAIAALQTTPTDIK
jgi:anti-sigma B factor antagonist